MRVILLPISLLTEVAVYQTVGNACSPRGTSSNRTLHPFQ